MEALAKVPYSHSPHLPLHHHRSSFSRPISSLSFRTSPPPRPFSIKSSSSPSPSSSSNSPNPKPQNPQTLTSSTLSLLKTTFITAVAAAAAALLFHRFNSRTVLAAPTSPPPAAETAASDEQREKTLEEHLDSRPGDVESLRALMELKIKNRKVHEAIGVIDRLIELEPTDNEWPLLKSHMYCYNGELELAKLGFNEILSKDPLRVEAYHGLVMVASQADLVDELKEIEKQIMAGMEVCKKENKKEDLRDFQLLIAQIRVIEGNYNEALKVYQELVKEEPRDFRPYLCQGIIYTLLGKKDEAEKQFQKYRRLVPKGHPYARYFDDNMLATKVFAQKVENEGAGSKR